MHHEVKGIMAKLYHCDGARVSVSKPVSNNFQVTHTIQMGGVNSYRFGTTYVGEPKFGTPETASPILVSDLDAEGNLMAQIHYNLTPALKAKLEFQAQGKNDMTTLEMDYRGKDYTVNTKMINPDIVNETGVWTGSYFQSITKRLALGAELAYQYHTGGIEEAAISMGGRYKTDVATFVGSIAPSGHCQFSYGHKVNEKITLGAEFEGNLGTRDALASVGYQFDLRQNVVRGQIDSKGVITGILENKLAPGLSFTISGQVNQVTGKSTFGLGFTLG